MQSMRTIMEYSVQNGASDIFIIAGVGISARRNGVIIHEDETRMMPSDTEALIRELYQLAQNRDMTRLLTSGDDDFSFAVPSLSRFRVSAYKQRGSLSAVIRAIAFQLPNPADLHIPEAVISLAERKNGMILVTGPAGSGKSTTLACIIDRINQTRASHIITMEDPIEYLHRHNKSLVSQREIDIDTENYVTALRAALRQSPDVILLGEMRDYETISVALTSAETGHLLLSTLHTIGASNTISRIIDVFPANQQQMVAVQLSTVLGAVVSQQLLPALDGSIVPAFEIMTVTPAIRNLIRDNKVYQIDGLLRTATQTMVSMDASLEKLYRNHVIDKETALLHATNPDLLNHRLH